MIQYEHWTEEARCNSIPDPDIFFPPRDKELYKKIATEAKLYCLGESGKDVCPVRAQCLWAAVKDNEQHGIWGGMSHRERNALVRKWSRNYKDQMTLEEYIFQLDKKENKNETSNKTLRGSKEVFGR
jgi:WhiB family transcriptional regulator, redox-sensing transcriptional regulator